MEPSATTRDIVKSIFRPKQRAAREVRGHVGVAATLVLLAFLLYRPSLDGPFVFDDTTSVTDNDLIRRAPLSAFFLLSGRPLTDYSVALDYALGGLNPRPYHVTNVLLHAANAILLYIIAWRTLALPVLASRYPARRTIGWAAAALFTAHPLATEAVAYVSSRSELLVAFFYLLALSSFERAAKATSPRARVASAALLPIWTAAALASKEIAVTIPAALWLWDWCFLASGTDQPRRSRWRLYALAMLPLAAAGALLVYRAYTAPAISEPSAGFGFGRIPWWRYFLTQPGVIFRYFSLVLIPTGLTVDYDWPLATTPWALPVILPVAWLALLAVFAWLAVRAQPLFTFAVFWTLIVLAPTSSVLPIADVAVERRMYLPLAALMMLAAAWLWEGARVLSAAVRAARLRAPVVYAIAVAAVVVTASLLTTARAAVWANPIALYEDGVAKAPGNPRVRMNLGATYLGREDYDAAYQTLLEAKALYEDGESIQAFPRVGAFIYYNLGAVLYLRGEYDSAESELRHALDLGGQYLSMRPVALRLLGYVAAQRKDWAKASTYLERSLADEYNPDVGVDLARMQIEDGRPDQARDTLRMVLSQHPDHARAVDLLQSLD